MPNYQTKQQIKPVEETPTEVIIKLVKIESLIESRLIYVGRVSGKQYEWSKAGSVISVDERDVSELLEKRLGKKTCCGDGTNRIFQIAL